MKTSKTTRTGPKTNKVLGLYTIIMVSLSITYAVSTMIHHLG